MLSKRQQNTIILLGFGSAVSRELTVVIPIVSGLLNIMSKRRSSRAPERHSTRLPRSDMMSETSTLRNARLYRPCGMSGVRLPQDGALKSKKGPQSSHDRTSGILTELSLRITLNTSKCP